MTHHDLLYTKSLKIHQETFYNIDNGKIMTERSFEITIIGENTEKFPALRQLQ